MRLILINGQPGTGKTSVSKKLLSELGNSAYFDADVLVATNPWEFGGSTNTLMIKNAVSLVSNFSKSGFQNIIISGLTRNQEILDKFLEQLNKTPDTLFVWLHASKEIRMARKKERGRDGADENKYFDFVDELIPDIETIELKDGHSILIDTSTKTIESIVKQIKGAM